MENNHNLEKTAEIDDRYILKVRNLKQYFPIKSGLMQRVVGNVKAVDDISFRIERGKTMGLVGESGCGKTTVGKTLLRLNDPTGGEVYFNGINVFNLDRKEMRELRPKMQMIFQDPYSSLSPRMPVSEIIGEAVREHELVAPEEFNDYVDSVMLSCGLQPYHKDRYPHEFSGGQRQRICIARSLALKPDFIVCDEPVSALDVSIQAQIINLLEDLQNQREMAYLFISHDLSVVQHISDYVGVMYLGDLVEYADKKTLFANPMHPYSQALLSAAPVPDPDYKMNRIILEGSIPSPANPPKGCKFHTRCRFAMDICKTEAPRTREIEPGHLVVCHLYNEQGTLVEEDSETSI
jgi:peptide/nickel transport system ATP-binding protein